MFEPVGFPSEGALLRGRLYLPPASGPAPAVVMAHGTSATITMVTDRYAEVFLAAGFVVLLYDHRNFGASDGEPRQEINPWIQARGFRDAVTFVVALAEVDAGRIALWGDSYAGAEVVVVGATDERVAAIVAQVPACGAERPPPDPRGVLFAALRETLASGAVDGDPDETVGPMPVVSADQLNAPSLLVPIQAFRWFIDHGARFGTGWQNRATRVVPRTPAPFHAGIAAPFVRCPTLLLIAPDDEMPHAAPSVSRSVFDAIVAPKELLEIDGGHFGLLYHPSEMFDVASGAQRDFLVRTLGPA